jgi:hypothetical protein
MAFALLFALALSGAQPPTPSSDQPVAASTVTSTADAPASADEKALSREEMEDAIPADAPKDDYSFVAWCHGALAGQIELDPLVEKDMDAIEGKVKAAQRKADDVAITKEHKRYLALYEKALSAAEKASPTAIHQQGVDAELQGYKIWGATRNKPPIWRMVDWGNWEVPPRCEKAAKRLYDRASLFGEALKAEGPSEPAVETPQAQTVTPIANTDAAKPASADVAKPPAEELRGPQ